LKEENRKNEEGAFKQNSLTLVATVWQLVAAAARQQEATLRKL